MKIAFLIYPGFTTLDAIGPFDVLSRLPGADVQFVAKKQDPIANDNDLLRVLPTSSLSECSDPDILLIPGGMEGTQAAANDAEILDWVRQAHQSTTWTTTVCTGSLILGATGLLQGLNATTHWAAQEQLAQTGATYQAQRWVQEGKIITAAGVSAGIDMALHLVSEIAGPQLAQAIQLMVEYDPQPPFDSGSLAKASPEVVKMVQAGMERRSQ